MLEGITRSISGLNLMHFLTAKPSRPRLYAICVNVIHQGGGGRGRLERRADGAIDIIFSFGADVAIDSVRPAIGNTITAAADHL